MRGFFRAAALLLLVAALAFGIVYYLAGTRPGPAIDIRSPDRLLGQRGQLTVAIEAPGAALTSLEVTIAQEARTEPVFSSTQPGAGEMQQETPDRVVVSRPLGQSVTPWLKPGAARVSVTASRPVLYGLRETTTVAHRDVEVRLQPPRVGVVSLHHFINHGGAEFVVYRVSPGDARSGVRVGEVDYPGFPGAGAGLSDPDLHVAFFALTHDQDRNAPFSLFARDDAGNESTTPLDHQLFPRPFAKSRIEIDDRFLARVVPAIASNSPGLMVGTGTPDELLAGFLTINGKLRQQNNETVRAMAARTRPEMLWKEAFSQLGNTAVQSRFADYRTYFYRNREIDRQVHLGFDLASLAQAPVHASNRGIVLFAGFLGIYGNAVVVDHGLGVQSLYAHFSSIGVKEGDVVEKGQELGRTGMTGLAGGDHLHFTMLVNGVAVNPVEWWDPHWMEDRVFRKIREAR